jgi:hypothetical protein
MPDFHLITGSNNFKMEVPHDKSCVVVLLSSREFLPFVQETIEHRLREKDFADFKNVPRELLDYKHFCKISFTEKHKLGKSFSVRDHGKKITFHFDVAVEVTASRDDILEDYIKVFGANRSICGLKFVLSLDCENVKEISVSAKIQ